MRLEDLPEPLEKPSGASWRGPRKGPQKCPISASIDVAQLYLRSKLKLKLNYPPDPGRSRPQIIDLLRKLTVRALPPDPPEEGEQEKNEKAS